MPPDPTPPAPQSASFDSFSAELTRLVERFDRQHPTFTSPDYNEATLRADFLDPFFRALGWDVGNQKGLIHTEREVDIEVRTTQSGRQTRADYVFRVARTDRFTCEAKKPAEALHDRHIFQAKRDAFNRGIPLALLSDFEELKIFVVGARPILDEPHTGEWKVLHFRQYPDAARDLWDLLAYENVAAGSVDRLIDSLPKRPLKLKGRQGYLIKPDRTRALDSDFLNFLDGVRQQLGSDLLKHNDRADLLSGHRLNEAAQRIIDRLVFLRICEDRGIDTGTLLETLFTGWYRQQPESRQPKLRKVSHQTHLRFGSAAEEEPGNAYTPRQPAEGGLYRELTEHIRALDQRPPSYKPFFNGQLFKPHFSEDLVVGDEWLANFILDLTADDSGYNFADIKVEILGDAYERFLGHILVPKGRGTAIEEKPEVRKAGGVYYTPRYITDYIVEQTIGRLLEGKTPREVEKLRFLDPACGSGSFLIRAYERVMEHYLRYFTANPEKRRKDDCFVDAAGNVRLTTALKRRILENNIYGVDIDAQAVEVTQLSLYLKMLEGENRDTLRQQTELFRGEPLLPPLDKNIKCFNSLIGSDFSLDPAELIRVNAGDWDMQFEAIMKAGGFDAVVGNPPWLMAGYYHPTEVDYLKENYASATGKFDLYYCFIEKGLKFVRQTGGFGLIVPNKFLHTKAAASLRKMLKTTDRFAEILDFGDAQLFAGATNYSAIVLARPGSHSTVTYKKVTSGLETIEEAKIARAELPDADSWSFSERKLGNLFGKLERNSVVLEKITLRFGTGCQTGSDKILTVQRSERGDLEKSILKPIIRGRDVRRYSLSEETKLAVFPYAIKDGDFSILSEKDLKGFPHAYKLLKENRSRLDARIWFGQTAQELSGAWYGYVYLDRKAAFDAPHILTPSLSNQANFCLGNGDLFLTGTAGVTSIIPSPKIGEDIKYLLGVLNSRLLSFYAVRHSPPFSGGYFKFSAPYLKKLPIRRIDFDAPADKSLHDRLVALVDKMLTLTPALRAAKSEAEKATLQNAVTKTDREIDQLVYQLYALTPEEIALVEGTAQSPA